MNKQHWNTQEICKLLEKDNYKISVSPSGGDVDTENILIEIDNCEDCLHIRGFNTDDYKTALNGKDTYIEMIELTDGLNSNGGLNSKEKGVVFAYADVYYKLISNGFTVVKSLDNYF